MNIDYELVGFYQAHLYGACFTHDMLDSLVDYQSYIQDGVVLVYGNYYKKCVVIIYYFRSN